MVTIILVLSITNKQTGLRENCATVNNENKVRQFALDHKDELINLEGFKINDIRTSFNLTIEEQFYIERMQGILEDTQRGESK